MAQGRQQQQPPTSSALAVSYSGRVAHVPLGPDGPHEKLSSLAAALAAEFSVDPATIKLLLPGGKSVAPAALPGANLAQAGIKAGSAKPLRMVASSAAAVAQVRAARSALRDASFDHDEQRELLRRGLLPPVRARAPSLPAGPYTFRSFEAWQRPGLRPPPSEALKARPAAADVCATPRLEAIAAAAPASSR